MNNDSNRSFQAFLIYTSLLLDNVLLTVIVPILPDYLSQLNNVNISIYNIPNSLIYKNYDLHYVPVILGKHPLTGSSLINFTITNNYNNINNNNNNNQNKERYEDYSDLNNFNNNNNNNNNNENDRKRIILDDENSSIGILLAAKAITQLFITPIIGNLTLHVGYRLPIIFGTFCLLVTSLVFAIGASYISLLIARSLQGVASACIGVCGMSLVAQLYPEEDKRSKVMGIVLGSIALGVLLGYPIGGILYDFVGKSAPFYITSILILINLITQLYAMDYKHTKTTEIITVESKYCTLLSDGMILKISIAICISTTAMAILEPCLPIWLIENLSPKKWQIGTVFIPDSIGYFIGTNFFGSIAYKFGQIKISIISMFLVGVSCFLIPNATSILSLLFPHFSLGLGIGILDAALIPLLASLVDSKYNNDDQSSASTDSMSSYGTVYSIQQISVSIAYSLGPILGGEIAQYIGFRWLMTLIGLINIFYGFFLFIYYILFPIKDILLSSNNNTNNNNDNDINLTESKINFKNDYKRFYDTMDIP